MHVCEVRPPLSVKLVHLRLSVISHVLASDEAQISTPEARCLPARLVLALRRAPERRREGDLCEVAVQESDAPALMECVRRLASRPGVAAIERDRFLEAVTAVASAPER
jgi:hypothetical protein